MIQYDDPHYAADVITHLPKGTVHEQTRQVKQEYTYHVTMVRWRSVVPLKA